MNFRVTLRKFETGLDLSGLTAHFKITVNHSALEQVKQLLLILSQKERSQFYITKVMNT